MYIPLLFIFLLQQLLAGQLKAGHFYQVVNLGEGGA